MANVKFTEFPSATTLTGTEIIPIVQAGTNKKVTATLLKAFADSGYVPYVGATTDLNLDTHDLYTAKVWLNDIPNAGFGSMELTDGVLHFEDVDGHSMFSMEDGYFAVNNGPTIRALFNVSALTANRDFTLPNTTGTLALTSNLSSYLPLAGGTLTGALNGTSSVFSSSVTAKGDLFIWGGNAAQAGFITGNSAGGGLYIGATGTNQNIRLVPSGTGFVQVTTSLDVTSSVTASSLIKSGGTSSQYLMADGSTSTLTNPITGTGTAGYISRFSGSTIIGDSLIFSDGVNVGIGTTTPDRLLTVNGVIKLNGDLISAVGGNTFRIGYEAYSATGGVNMFTEGAVPLVLGTTSTERMRITSSGNVGIGTSTPSEKLEVQNGAAGAKIKVSNSGGGFATLECSSNATSVAQLSFTNELTLTGGNVILSNALKVGTGLSLSNATAPASGIEFPATQVASASANNLDDYEEGTFTATLTPSTSGSITLSVSTGSYTKIGRQVTLRGQILISSVSLPVGSVVILGGLPFISNSSVSTRGAGVAQYFPSVGGALLLNNYQLQSSLEWGFLIDASTVTGGSEIYFQLTYFA